MCCVCGAFACVEGVGGVCVLCVLCVYACVECGVGRWEIRNVWM